EQATRARTLLEQARLQLEELNQLQGAKVCRHCGQNLTPGHLKDEKRRREAEVAGAEQHWQRAKANQQAAQKRAQEVAAAGARLDQLLQQAGEECGGHRQKAEQARQDVERLQGECGRTYHELPEPFRALLSPDSSANWLETTYPSTADLDEARK